MTDRQYQLAVKHILSGDDQQSVSGETPATREEVAHLEQRLATQKDINASLKRTIATLQKLLGMPTEEP